MAATFFNKQRSITGSGLVSTSLDMVTSTPASVTVMRYVVEHFVVLRNLVGKREDVLVEIGETCNLRFLSKVHE